MKKYFLIPVFSLFLFISLAKAQTYTIGANVEVKNKGYWYQASISDKNSSGLYKVQYCGMDSGHDEWVSTSRMRNNYYKIGDQVQVLLKDNWYPAKVLKKDGSQYYIDYDGYDSTWNEWVSCSRIRKNV